VSKENRFAQEAVPGNALNGCHPDFPEGQKLPPAFFGNPSLPIPITREKTRTSPMTTNFSLAIVPLILVLLSTCTLVSCQPPPPVNALKSGHWQQVQQSPSIYFPKEIPAAHPTTFRDGYWVYSGDQRGTRFFIPFHGTDLSAEELVEEAQATMTPAAREELDSRDRSWHSWIVSADSFLFLEQTPDPNRSF
jgi:hypothetical protein